MKKLCVGSYLSVLVKCKAFSVRQKQLIGVIMSNVNPNYDISYDDGTVAALVRGKNNLSANVVLFIDDVADHLSSIFSSSIIPLLNANKRTNIVLALKDILREDDEIDDDTEVELLNHLTKRDILQRECFVFSDLLAGIFIYTVKYTDNHNMREYIEEITDTYIRELDTRAEPITFIESYSLENLKEIQKTSSDIRIMNLMAEQEGNCPLCGKLMTANNYILTILSDKSEMLLCVECNAKVNHSDNEMSQALEVKKSLQSRQKMRDAVSENRLINETRYLLERLPDISSGPVELRYTPLNIEKKVSDYLLGRKIKGFITDGMYDAVNSCIENLATENRLNVRELSKCVRRAFEDANDTSDSQSDIFNTLAKNIFIKTGQKYYEACELLVSYFVQRCEVFNEIAK